MALLTELYAPQAFDPNLSFATDYHDLSFYKIACLDSDCEVRPKGCWDSPVIRLLGWDVELRVARAGELAVFCMEASSLVLERFVC